MIINTYYISELSVYVTVYRNPPTQINFDKIYGIYVDVGSGYMYSSHTTKKGQRDAYNQAMKSGFYKEHIKLVDKIYLTEEEWKTHGLYKYVTVRKISELLTLLKKTLEQGIYPVYGLCGHVKEMYDMYLINSKERDKLYDYINDNKPKSIWYRIKNWITRNNTSGYYWSRFDKESRIKWLDKHIKLNQL